MIVFVNRVFYPDESATSQLLTDLTRHLIEMRHEVVVVTGRSNDASGKRLSARDSYCGVEIHRVRTASPRGRSLLSKLLQYLSFYPGAFVELLRLLKKGDVVVAKTDPPLISVVAMLVAKVKGARLVNWIQDLYPEVAIELETPLMKGPLGGALAAVRNRALAAAEMNAVLGSRMAQRIGHLGIRPEKIAVLPNWADERAIRPIQTAQSAARRMWGFGPSDFVVGYSGNLGQAHEVDTLIGAARILRTRDDIRFLFIGAGHQHDRLQQLIEEAQLTSFVFKPHQPRDHLADTLAAADVHWVSLRPRLEGLIVPSKLYGILAAARPVLSVCDTDGEVSRVVREHSCGIVVQPGDAEGLAEAIVRLADDPELRHELGRRARAASERAYSKATALGAWSTVLRQVGAVSEHPKHELAAG